jgi:BT_3987-like, N-terminal domain
MKFINLRVITFFVLTGLLFSSCEKVEVAKPLGDRGQTIVKFMTSPNDNGSNYNLVTIELLTTPQTLGLIDIRRDVPNETELNKTLTVTIKEDPSVISTFNNVNNTPLVALPAGSYTADPSNPRTGSDYSVTFQPGEISKVLKIKVTNASTMDLSKRYAIGLTMLVTVTGADGRVSFDNRSTVVEIGPKNKWDGHYKVTGTMVDNTSAALTGSYPFEANLETASANEVILYHTGSPFTGYYHPILSSGSGSAYGNFVPVFVIDPTTNKVVDVYNGYGQHAMPQDRSGKLDPAGINTWDPVNKILKVSYFMLQPGTTVRTTFNEVFTYLRPR